MLDFVLWYVLISLLGLLVFPFAYRIFNKLPDRGYALSRVFGLLLWGFIFWLLTSLQLLQNDTGGVLIALGIVLGFGFWFYSWKFGWKDLTMWFEENKSLVIMTEVVFLFTFGLWALVRATDPATVGTEKPMEMAFINAILRSPTFPPNDPWLSGYSISYYYFGFVLAAMLVRVTESHCCRALSSRSSWCL